MVHSGLPSSFNERRRLKPASERLNASPIYNRALEIKSVENDFVGTSDRPKGLWFDYIVDMSRVLDCGFRLSPSSKMALKLVGDDR